jgi:hypothetical protein
MSLNARGVKTPDLVASLESYNSCRGHFPNLTRWESEKSLRKADFLDFWNLGTQFLPPKWRSRTISSPKTQKYWQTIFIRLCDVYKQATNPVYLSFRPRHHDLIILDFQLNIKFEQYSEIFVGAHLHEFEYKRSQNARFSCLTRVL